MCLVFKWSGDQMQGSFLNQPFNPDFFGIQINNSDKEDEQPQDQEDKPQCDTVHSFFKSKN
jgi:hypothetical protein